MACLSLRPLATFEYGCGTIHKRLFDLLDRGITLAALLLQTSCKNALQIFRYIYDYLAERAGLLVHNREDRLADGKRMEERASVRIRKTASPENSVTASSAVDSMDSIAPHGKV